MRRFDGEFTRKFALWAASLAMFLFLILAVFNFYALNNGFYKKEFEKNRVYEKIPNADYVASDLLSFFLGFKEELSLRSLYSDREIIHIGDVKKLFQAEISITVAVFFVLVLLLAAQYYARVSYAQTLFISAIMTIIASVFAAILGFFFDSSFVLFHKILFSNDYWLLHENSAMITMFPNQFFIDFFFSFMATAFIFGVCMLIISSYLVYGRQTKKYINKAMKSKTKRGKK